MHIITLILEHSLPNFGVFIMIKVPLLFFSPVLKNAREEIMKQGRLPFGRIEGKIFFLNFTDL